MSTNVKCTSPSGKARIRESCNADQANPITINERILKECNLLYTDSDKGLVKVAEQFGLKLLAPRKKIVVLLIGNHSAGKSSFINWYIEEHVQKTGVATETQGFVVVTSGKRRESLMGNATLHLYPHFKPMEKITGIVDFLSTEISTSKQKKFSLVTFVDTPGLVDGDTHYPFDVNKALLWLGGMADLILIFFDPIGQALCKRTLSIVELLNIEHVEKMRFYLSKADDAGDEADRQKVMMQIVQELCKRPGLNRTGFDMPTIYVPTVSKNTRCLNQIDTVCQEIEKVICRNIQTTLNVLERDCELLLAEIKKRIDTDNENNDYNLKNFTAAVIVGGAAAVLIVLMVKNILPHLKGSRKNVDPVETFWSFVPVKTQLSTFSVEKESFSMFVWFFFSYVLFAITRWFLGSKPTLSRKQRKQFLEIEEYVKNTVKPKKEALYKDYLEQSVGDHDL